MEYLLDGGQMKAVDRYNIEELGIPSLVLMERAALAVSGEAVRMTPPGGKVLALCGTGNNGADGLAAARHLHLKGFQVQAVLVGKWEKATEENRLQQRILEKLGVPVGTGDGILEYDRAKGYDLILDGIFGVGLSRPVEGTAAAWIRAVCRAAESGTKVLSLDIPSGVYAGGGASDPAVRAHETVTFGYGKLGMALYPGASYCGTIVTADIGFAPPPWMSGTGERLVRSFRRGEPGLLPFRPADGHKGTFGRVLVAAGSPGMCGAAYFSAMAACRMGAGLVQVLTVRENIPVLQTLLPEAVLSVCRVEDGKLAPGMEEQIGELCRRADVLAAGPGLSREPYARELLSLLLKERKDREIPAVLDADALNIMAEDRDLLEDLGPRVIVTPHMGEMARLTGIGTALLKSRPLEAAREFRERYGAVCVLKDARTAVASERGLYLNRSGTDGMGTGGSGDVLSGILAGFLAGGLTPAQAAESGVYLHGLAGEWAAGKYGRRAMTARDLLEGIGPVLMEWENSREEQHGDI